MKLAIFVGPKVKREQVNLILKQIEIPSSIVLAGTMFDAMIEKWARSLSLPIEKILSHSRYHREYASFIRNERLAEHADCILILYVKKGLSVNHVFDRFRARAKPVIAYQLADQRAIRLWWKASSSNVPEKQRVLLYKADEERAGPSF